MTSPNNFATEINNNNELSFNSQQNQENFIMFFCLATPHFPVNSPIQDIFFRESFFIGRIFSLKYLASLRKVFFWRRDENSESFLIPFR
jgi:hypothetical protein